MDGLRLTYTMAAVLGLLVHRRVPISVIKDNAIGACQVDADTATSGGGDETEDLLVQVETVYKALPHFYLDGTIESHVGVAVQVQERLENVEDPGHLSEN